MVFRAMSAWRSALAAAGLQASDLDDSSLCLDAIRYVRTPLAQDVFSYPIARGAIF